MPSSLVMKLAGTVALFASGCLPVHDYEGDYDMTFDVIMTSPDGNRVQAAAGTAEVEVNQGLNAEYLLHLGAAFCLLEGNYVEAETWTDQPYMDIPPQACWFAKGGKTIAMSLGGSATYTDGEERFAIVLGGSFVDEDGRVGSATVEITESW
jgi:hypothetical protein